MKPADFDWSVMRVAVILLTVAVLLSGAVLAGGYHFWGQMNREYQARRTDLLNVRGRFQTLDEEEKIIEAFLPRFRALESEGIIGREHRLNWIETLRSAANRIRLPSLRYSIAQQEPGGPPYLGDTGGFQVYGSEMTLDLGLLHEGDLVGVMRELDRAAVGLYTITACDFRRAGNTLSQNPKQANLFVTCTLLWHTMRHPQPAGPAA